MVFVEKLLYSLALETHNLQAYFQGYIICILLNCPLKHIE